MNRIARKGESRSRGSAFLVIIGFLTVMLLLAMGLSHRFAGQAQISVLADQGTIARYFLESCLGDVLWQVRCRRNIPGDDIFAAFRGGPGVSVVPFPYRPSPAISAMADKLGFTLGPVPPVVFLERVKALPFAPSAFRQVGRNEEKQGIFGIVCMATFRNRQYTMQQKFPFKVVQQTTPILRRFLLFFDQLHLEQHSPFGHQDRINVIPIRSNLPQQNRTPLTLYGWDFLDRERNGLVFLGSDEHKIFLNLVGGRYEENSHRLDLEDLWQISPSAFTMTAGHREFGEEPLLNDDDGKPVFVRGAGINLAYRGHAARFGLLGFSEEIGGAGSSLLGDFKLGNFLTGDPSFAELKKTTDSMQQAAALRLQGNRLRQDFPGFARDIYGNVFARFFLLSFFEAPSVGSPISFSGNPDQTLSFQQYGNAQMITFKPVQGRYCNYMSRVVSGGNPVPSLGAAVDVPLNRDPELNHRLLKSYDLPEIDGLKPARSLAAISQTWFSDGPYAGPGGRPQADEGTVLGRITRYFRNQEDFKKAVGLTGPGSKRCWVDGVVYIHGPLDLTDGIATTDIRGGVVLVRGAIKLGNVARGETDRGFLNAAGGLNQDKVLTFVSLTGEEITLTGNRYLGVQLFSFRPRLTGPVAQLGFPRGSDVVFLGGLGVSTPQMDRLSRQLVQRGLYPMVNYLPSLGKSPASYSVHISERILGYDFSVL